MTGLMYDWIIPLWLSGLIPGFLICVFARFNFVDTIGNNLTALGKIQMTKMFLVYLPLWPIYGPIFAFKGVVLFYNSYKEWKQEANLVALQKVSDQLDSLERSIDKYSKLNSQAVAQRKRYDHLLTKMDK